MEISAIQEPKDALNKAFRIQAIEESDFAQFQDSVKGFLNAVQKAGESKATEEHIKTLLRDFLKEVHFGKDHNLNTRSYKGQHEADLVIYPDKTTKGHPAVLFEIKRPGSNEMIQREDLNRKALWEAALYYLWEKVEHDNHELKHIVITNTYEWFVFDAIEFHNKFFEDKSLIKFFKSWKGGTTDSQHTQQAYDVIKKKVETHTTGFNFTYFNLQNYLKKIGTTDAKSIEELASLYKLLSPQHLLKKPFENDSNTINKPFYYELLHLIGLEEEKQGGKKVIRRKKSPDRGSLIENAIQQIKADMLLQGMDNRSQYGDTEADQLFNVALDLSITWINRILFMKLLESQLVHYHNGQEDFRFMKASRISDFDTLNSLFFQVLAIPRPDRAEKVKEQYHLLPYLNSSLFEPTALEKRTLRISNLLNDLKLPVYKTTVFRNDQGKKASDKEFPALQYLLHFLDAYDFGAQRGLLQKQKKQLINASVLGLIFEKINGYKDGSYFTPGFITMYMSRETLGRAVVQKFNSHYGWEARDADHLFNFLDKGKEKEYNSIINSITVCDPAVGSGHFLVSALNEIIAIKSRLGILCDSEGRILRNYRVTVENDELHATDADDEIFEYRLNTSGKPPEEIQRVQKALFEEKQRIIEFCLFGVDINPNSVKICTLRLWIELLKNAYYTAESNYEDLHTLPNIDINIKCGNSLISKFSLEHDLQEVFKKQKFNLQTYKNAVTAYKETRDPQAKADLVRFIGEIKEQFHENLVKQDPLVKKISKVRGEITVMKNPDVFGVKKGTASEIKEKEKQLATLEQQREDIEQNVLFRNSFEWRFEFPEVLDNKGNFTGFDVVIGNPPYGVKFNIQEKKLLSKSYSTIDDIYAIFIDKSLSLVAERGILNLIIPIFWLTGDNYFSTRKMIKERAQLEIGIILPYDVFVDAYVDTGIFLFEKKLKRNTSLTYEFQPREKIDMDSFLEIEWNVLENKEWENTIDLKIVFNPISRVLKAKIVKLETSIESITDSARGILASSKDYAKTKLTEEYSPIFTGKIDRYYQEEKVGEFIKYGENLKEKPSSFDFFTGKRILIRRIVSRQFRIMATIATEPFVTKKDIYIFKLNGGIYSLEFILGILNSSFISFMKTNESTSAKKDDFTQLTLKDIRQLRIPTADTFVGPAITLKVNQILSAKKANPQADTSALEREIDEMVYELYGLTEEEIKIVEGEHKPIRSGE